MHALHEHLARELADRLDSRRIVVVYDPRSELVPFFDRELMPAADAPTLDPTQQAEVAQLSAVHVGRVVARLARFDGSLIGLRAAVEPFAGVPRPDPLVLYLPGVTRDRTGSPLLELELAGVVHDHPLRSIARNVLRQRFTDGQIDDLLNREIVTYDDVVAFLRQSEEGDGTPSLLRTLFEGLQSEPLLAGWLAADDHDEQIVGRGALPELTRLIESRLGLTLPPDATVDEARAGTARYLLVAEFRADLAGEPPAAIEMVPAPRTKEQLGRIRDVLNRLRHDSADAYVGLADLVERELGLADADLDAARLGSIDTFRFEERRLLGHTAGLIVAKDYNQTLAIATERGHSFWLDRDLSRRGQWEAIGLMAELGREVERVRAEIDRVGQDAASWLTAYTADGGWHRVDGLQRALDAWIARMDDDPEGDCDRALALVRREHDVLLKRMAEGFSRAFQRAGRIVPGVLHQTRIYPDVVRAAGGLTAYVFVDALRYEMGAELARQLEGLPEVAVQPAVAALPSITAVGMAALLPAASGSFSVVAQGKKLAARIEGTVMTGLADRMKALEARVPDVVVLSLDQVVQRAPSWLAQKIDRAPLVVVRSQEIDQMGELGEDLLARRVMDTIIADLARAVRKLGAAGVERFVVTADHGHLFSLRREDDMRTDSPGGDQLELHRRCWIGRGGMTPAGAVRVSGAELGYDTELEFVFPTGLGVFRASGDLSYHHGGFSLQELVIPVVTARALAAPASKSGGRHVTVEGVPATIVTRTFGVRVTVARELFEDEPLRLRALVIAPDGSLAGRAGMALNADFDRATRVITVAPGVEATIGLVLDREDVPSVRVAIQDPATDAVLAQTAEIPVKLGM